MGLEVVRGLGIALVLGLVIGFERGWEQREREEGSRTLGVRSFALVGLLGGLSALLAQATGPLVLALAWLALAALVTAAYLVAAQRTGDHGATTELAALLTFVLGALAVRGHAGEAAAATVVVAVLLRAKGRLHALLEAVRRSELDASLQLLLIAVVVLPLLPDRGYGPWDALNPRTLGWFVLLVAGISFVGYLALKLAGPRLGLLLTAAAGGLTSSTAVTFAYARMGARHASWEAWLAAGIGVAAATMGPRLLVEVAAVNPALLDELLLPLLLLTVLPLGASVWLVRGARRAPGGEDLEVSNPLELGPAVGYAAVLAAVLLLAHGAHAWLGEPGVYLLAGLSGLTDVDAVSLSLTRMARGDLPAAVAARGIVLAAVANTLVKAGIAAAVAGPGLGRRVAGVLLPAAAAAAGAAFLGLGTG